MKSTVRKQTLTKLNANDSTLELQRNWTVLLLSLMMMLAPAMGVPSEEVLQDTLKSAIISIATLIACFTYFWHLKNRDSSLVWHPILVLPIGLTLFALGSMFWSHAFLGGAEAVRWFIFSLIVWVGLNSIGFNQVPRLALGIHIGATAAALWTTLQFWIDFKYFPQGPNPASTFVNRNFFAEFLVCTLPFSIYLLTREKRVVNIYALTLTVGLNLVSLLMTGTRSVLLGLLLLAAVMPVIIFAFRDQLESFRWDIGVRVTVPLVLIFTVLGLGLIPTNNAQLIAEYGGGNAIDRTFSRTMSMVKSTEYTEGSFSIRATMWKATWRMIETHPFTGVGAGAWEVHAPLYQSPGTQLETDFYAHNEFLQLIAEYGIVGWIFLAGLLVYLLVAALSTWKLRKLIDVSDGPVRSFALASILVFLLVSNAGFPWRLATTGALFALSLAVLAGSDQRAQTKLVGGNWSLILRKAHAQWVLALFASITLCAIYVAQQAMECESKLVRGIKIALTISKSGQPNDPRWAETKLEMLELLRQGIVINPHYRKLTPMAADELASWGDWRNAVWIWESVFTSRPNVVAIAANISRGYLVMGNAQKAQEYLDRAEKLQPSAPSVKSLRVEMLAKTGNYQEASTIIRELFDANLIDYDLAFRAYLVGVRSKDWALAIQALEFRIKKWPNEASDGWLKLGDIYSNDDMKNHGKALECYRKAVSSAPTELKEGVRKKIPQPYLSEMVS